MPSIKNFRCTVNLQRSEGKEGGRGRRRARKAREQEAAWPTGRVCPPEARLGPRSHAGRSPSAPATSLGASLWGSREPAHSDRPLVTPGGVSACHRSVGWGAGSRASGHLCTAEKGRERQRLASVRAVVPGPQAGRPCPHAFQGLPSTEPVSVLETEGTGWVAAPTYYFCFF